MDTRIEDIDISQVPFANCVLELLDQRSIIPSKAIVTSVDLSLVVGTTHSDYGGEKWGALKPEPGSLQGDICNTRVAYQPLKRANLNCQLLHRNPQYYLSKDEKEHWSFYKIGGVYYISEGNNRTVVARYFFHLNQLPTVVHGVRVSEAVLKQAPAPKEGTESESFLQRLLAWFR